MRSSEGFLQEKGKKEKNSELWENAAELLSKEERLSWFTDRRNKASHECEYSLKYTQLKYPQLLK